MSDPAQNISHSECKDDEYNKVPTHRSATYHSDLALLCRRHFSGETSNQTRIGRVKAKIFDNQVRSASIAGPWGQKSCVASAASLFQSRER